MKFIELEMTTTERKPVSLEVLDLQYNETVVDATIVHTPPQGGSPIVIEYTVDDNNFINMMFGPFAVSGYHFVNVQAEGNGTIPSFPEVTYFIKVRS